MPTAKEMMEKKTGDRRVSKPLMEKRRRARINQSLTELKSLLTDSSKSETRRHAKLEKADILEMAVKHLKELHRKYRSVCAINDPTLKNKFCAGFIECAKEVEDFLAVNEEISENIKQRLALHLSKRANDLKRTFHNYPCDSAKSSSSNVDANDIQSENGNINIAQNVGTPYGTITSSTEDLAISRSESFEKVSDLLLVPRRLPNGDIAFVLPHQVTVSGRPINGTTSCPVSAFRLICNESLNKGSPPLNCSSERSSSSLSSELSDVSNEDCSIRPNSPVQQQELFQNVMQCGETVWRPW